MAQPTNGQPTVFLEMEFDIPAEVIWPLLADFGSWGNWCPLFTNMRVSNGKKGVGAIRKYKMLIGGSGYEEVLKELDNQNFSLRYDNVSITPPLQGVNGVSSTIVLKKIDDKRTHIARSSWITAPGMTAEVLATVKALQTKSYQKEIEFLKVHAIAGQMIGTGMGFFNDKLMLMTKALLTGQSQTWEYEEYPDFMGFLPKMVKGLPMSEVLPAHKIGDMITRFVELVYLQAKQYIIANLMPPQQADNIDPYTKESQELVKMGYSKPQGLVELTDYLTKHWESDEEFCQQLLQGVNPLHIKAVNEIEDVPDIFTALTITEKSGEKKSVKQLIHEKRLFMCDYRELSQYSWVGQARFYAPVMLVYRQIVSDKESHLNVLGIQLDSSRNELFTPDMPQKNRYKLAKMFVACADTQFHEFRYHLVIAHMGMEPICIATHNRLPKTHALNALLAPHLEGTIGIAFFARQTLIAEKEAFTDKTFALGTKQGLRLASDGWRKYHFFKSSFPKQLEERGFYEDGRDGVQNYLYRDDGFKLWNALGDYATDVVNKFYHDDAAVVADGDLQMWADELAAKDGGALPGFPSSINTKKFLVEVLQIILWNASAQHSVINYPQTPYLNLVPNRPNTMFGEMPPLGADKKDLTDDYVKSCLAPELPMLFQLLFTWLLSLPSDSNLANLEALRHVYPEGAHRFQERMAALSKELKARNETLSANGKAPYIYLLPENVAASVNI